MWTRWKDDLPETVLMQVAFSQGHIHAHTFGEECTLCCPRAESHVRVASHTFHMSPRGPNFNCKALEICENYLKGWVEIQPLYSFK